MSNAELLKEYNEVAQQKGAMKLKTWKGSKLQLQERIKSIKGLPQKEKEKPAEKLIKKLVEDKEKKDKTISVVQVAEDLGMNAKVARAKLRRKGMKANEGRWPTFERDSKEHKDFIALLKGE